MQNVPLYSRIPSVSLERLGGISDITRKRLTIDIGIWHAAVHQNVGGWREWVATVDECHSTNTMRVVLRPMRHVCLFGD